MFLLTWHCPVKWGGPDQLSGTLIGLIQYNTSSTAVCYVMSLPGSSHCITEIRCFIFRRLWCPFGLIVYIPTVVTAPTLKLSLSWPFCFFFSQSHPHSPMKAWVWQQRCGELHHIVPHRPPANTKHRDVHKQKENRGKKKESEWQVLKSLLVISLNPRPISALLQHSPY